MAVYRAHSAQAHVAAAEAELHAHRLNAASGRCVACGQFAPCERANVAFSQLARYGITTPPDWSGAGACPPERSRLRQAPPMTLLALRRTRAAGRTRTDRAYTGAAPPPPAMS